MVTSKTDRERERSKRKERLAGKAGEEKVGEGKVNI